MNDTKDMHNHDGIGCLEAIEALYSYLDGELNDPRSIREFEDHISHCRSCYSRSEIETLLTTRLRESEKSRTPDALATRLRELMDEF